MAKRRKRARRRVRRRGSRPIMKWVGVALLITLPLLYFLFTKVLFDPFEEPAPSFHLLVPRDVDVYVRRQSLASDFEDAIELRELGRLSSTAEWRAMERTDWWKGLAWPQELGAAVSDFEASLDEAPLDPLTDLLGAEMVLLGRVPTLATEPSAMAVLGRLSAKGKLACRGLETERVRAEAFPGSSMRLVEDNEVPGVRYHRLDLEDGTVWYWWRRSDLLVVGDDELLVRDVLRLDASAGNEASLGLSRLYTARMPRAPDSPEAHFSGEVMLELGALMEHLQWTEAVRTPSESAATEMLRRLVDLTLVRNLVGRVELDRGSYEVTLSGELDSHRVANERTGLVGSLAFDAGDRLRAKMGMVPPDTVALLTLNADTGALLESIFESFGDEEKVLMNQTLQAVARHNPGWNKVSNIATLVKQLERIFGRDLTLAVRSAREAVDYGVQPLPSLALIATLDDGDAWVDLRERMVSGWRAFGLEQNDMWQVEEGVGTRMYIELDGFSMPSIAWIMLERRTLVIGTDNDFVKEIVNVYADGAPSLASKSAAARRADELDDTMANLVLWADGPGVRSIMKPYGYWSADEETRIDFGVARIQKRRELLASDPRWRSYVGREDDISQTDEEIIDAQLDELLAADEKHRRDVQIPAVTETWLEQWSWLGLLRDVVVSLRLGERDVDLRVSVDSAAAR